MSPASVLVYLVMSEIVQCKRCEWRLCSCGEEGECRRRGGGGFATTIKERDQKLLVSVSFTCNQSRGPRRVHARTPARHSNTQVGKTVTVVLAIMGMMHKTLSNEKKKQSARESQKYIHVANRDNIINKDS